MPTNKRSKAAQLKINKAKGRAGELEAKIMYNLQGYDMVREPIGKDYKAIKRNPINPKQILEIKNVEVKTGGAKLSKLQKQTKKKKGLEIYRTDSFPFNML